MALKSKKYSLPQLRAWGIFTNLILYSSQQAETMLQNFQKILKNIMSKFGREINFVLLSINSHSHNFYLLFVPCLGTKRC